MRSSTVGIVVAGLALAAGAWFFARGAGERGAVAPREERPAPPQDEPLALRVGGSSAPAGSPTDAPASEPAAAALVPTGAAELAPAGAPAAASLGAQEPPTLLEQWERRYRGADSGAMHSRVRYLHEEIDAEAAQHFQRLREEGRYRALPVPRDAQGRAQSPMVALGVSDRIRHVFEVPARDEWHVVELPREEFPELYRLWDEKQWLVERVEALERVQED